MPAINDPLNTNRSFVFLGGTCNESRWREELKPRLQVGYFDPVVDDWNEEAQQLERAAKRRARWLLFVITPQMRGVFSIAEAVEAAIRRPHDTIFCVLEEYDGERFDEAELRSLMAVSDLIWANGATVFFDLDTVVDELNQRSAHLIRECETCQSCGRQYRTVYRVPDELWRQVTKKTKGGGLLCPTCFDNAARQQGIELFWSAQEGQYPDPPVE